jgi:Predicted periplasmic protein (DUF2092)
MIREKAHRLIALVLWGLILLMPSGVLAQTAPVGAQKQAAPHATKKKTATATKAATSASFELDPKAVNILKATGARLAGAHSVSFSAVETFESISRQGVPLVYANKSEVVLQQPN